MLPSSQVWNFLVYFACSDPLQNWKWESLTVSFACLKGAVDTV